MNIKTKTKLKPKTVYALTRDVINPKPDKRVNSDWRSKPIWKSGMRFKTTTFRVNDEICLLSLYHGKYSFQDFIADKAPKSLIDALGPVQSTINEELDMLNLSGWKSDAIDYLINKGVITRNQLIDACRVLDQEQDESDMDEYACVMPDALRRKENETINS